MKNLPLVETHSFSSKEAQQLLHNKFVVIMGDSIYRSIYKDLISILQTDKVVPADELKKKGETTFNNDKLVKYSGLGCGNRYREVREFCTDHHLVRCYFIPRIYSDYVESILEDFQTEPKPDVVIFNSCLWDLNRYQEKVPRELRLPKAIKQYKQNLEKLFERLDRVLPQTCLAIWNTALPIGEKPDGALYKEMEGEFCSAEDVEKATPMDVVEANFYGARIAESYGFDVLDLHFFFRFVGDLRIKDGIHWNCLAHRFITRRLLTFIADSWGVELEKRKPSTGISWDGATADQPASLQLPSTSQLHDDFSADDVPVRQLPEDREAPDSYGAPYVNRPVAGFEYSPQDPSPQHGCFIPALLPTERHSDLYVDGPWGGLDYYECPPDGGQLTPDPQFNYFFLADDVPIRQLLVDRETPDSYGAPYVNRPVAGFEYSPQDPSPQHGCFIPALLPTERHSDLYVDGPWGGPDYYDYPPDDGQLSPDPHFNDHHNGSYSNSSRRGGIRNSPEIHPNGSPTRTPTGRSRRAQRRWRPEFIEHRPRGYREGAHPYGRPWRGRGGNARRRYQRSRYVWIRPSRS